MLDVPVISPLIVRFVPSQLSDLVSPALPINNFGIVPVVASIPRNIPALVVSVAVVFPDLILPPVSMVSVPIFAVIAAKLATLK